MEFNLKGGFNDTQKKTSSCSDHRAYAHLRPSLEFDGLFGQHWQAQLEHALPPNALKVRKTINYVAHRNAWMVTHTDSEYQEVSRTFHKTKEEAKFVKELSYVIQPQYITPWLDTPNSRFNGRTPRDLFVTYDINDEVELYDMLYRMKVGHE